MVASCVLCHRLDYVEQSKVTLNLPSSLVLPRTAYALNEAPEKSVLWLSSSLVNAIQLVQVLNSGGLKNLKHQHH